jgi:transcriptional regulator with XRE-family HTH domain
MAMEVVAHHRARVGLGALCRKAGGRRGTSAGVAFMPTGKRSETPRCTRKLHAWRYANGIVRMPSNPLTNAEFSVKFFDRVLNPREIRRRLGMNQEQFWTQIGVTQSGGSRYESGREMPRPVKELLRLVHVEQIDLSQVKRIDFEIISYLKDAHPDLYRNLRRAARARAGGQDASNFADLALPAESEDLAPATGSPSIPVTDARHD